MQFLLRLQPMGVDLFCVGKKFLVFNLVSRNLKIKYRRSILGVFWTLLSPMATAAVYYFVFKVILAIKVPHYLMFILVGVLFWTFFSQTIMEGMESIVGNWGLVSKVPIPLQIFPYTGALTNLVTLLLSLPVILGIALASHAPLGAPFLLIIYYTACLFLSAYGFAHLLALAFVVFRDLRHLMAIIMQMWFYGTPVIYQTSMIPPKYQWIIYANPLGTLFAGLQQSVVDGTLPSAASVAITAGWTCAVVVTATIVHRTFSSGIVERI